MVGAAHPDRAVLGGDDHAAAAEQRGVAGETAPRGDPDVRREPAQRGEREEARRVEPGDERASVLGLLGCSLGALWRLPLAVRRLWLLRHSTETSGKVIRKGETEHVEGVPWMELTFEYEVDGTPYFRTVWTLRPDLIEDDEREVIIYEPRAPARSTTLDDIIGPTVPGAPTGSFPEACGYYIVPTKAKVTAGGEFEVRPGIAYNLLLLPPA